MEGFIFVLLADKYLPSYTMKNIAKSVQEMDVAILLQNINLTLEDVWHVLYDPL